MPPLPIDAESAPVKPSYPSHKTQPGRLLAALLRGQKINPLTGWIQLGIYRLADSAFQLRRTGWPIENIGLDVQNRFGEDCHVACYVLPNHAINDAGWIGQAFAEWVEMHPPKAKGTRQAHIAAPSIPEQTQSMSNLQ